MKTPVASHPLPQEGEESKFNVTFARGRLRRVQAMRNLEVRERGPAFSTHDSSVVGRLPRQVGALHQNWNCTSHSASDESPWAGRHLKKWSDGPMNQSSQSLHHLSLNHPWPGLLVRRAVLESFLGSKLKAICFWGSGSKRVDILLSISPWHRNMFHVDGLFTGADPSACVSFFRQASSH